MRSKAQREANVRYMKKIDGKYKKFNASLLAEEYEEMETILAEKGISKVGLIRTAIADIKKRGG